MCTWQIQCKWPINLPVNERLVLHLVLWKQISGSTFHLSGDSLPFIHSCIICDPSIATYFGWSQNLQPSIATVTLNAKPHLAHNAGYRIPTRLTLCPTLFKVSHPDLPGAQSPELRETPTQNTPKLILRDWYPRSHSSVEVSSKKLRHTEDMTCEGVGKGSLRALRSKSAGNKSDCTGHLHFECKAQFFVLVLLTGTNSTQKGELTREKETLHCLVGY